MRISSEIILGLSLIALFSCGSDNGDSGGNDSDVTPVVDQPKEETPVVIETEETFDKIALPSGLGANLSWEFQATPSDDFNYTFDAVDDRIDFGPNNKWYNFYHGLWDGPGTTYWKYDHVTVDGNDLVLKASRRVEGDESLPRFGQAPKMGRPADGISAGCITGNNRVKWPVFVEAKVSVADIVLASDVWLLSPDDTQEIDIIECYGGDEQGNAFFSKFIHLSHHSFIRQPFTDYQPRDTGSWFEREGVSSWGEFHYNSGERQYTRIGVNWISPFHFEYYIDGELVRVLYDKALAVKDGNNWNYDYPTMTNGQLDFENGFQKLTRHSTSSSYTIETLKAASDASDVSIIDPFDYQNGKGMDKAMDIIINVESQDWHVDAGRTPTDEQLNNPEKNTMKVDWIRVFKPSN